MSVLRVSPPKIIHIVKFGRAILRQSLSEVSKKEESVNIVKQMNFTKAD